MAEGLSELKPELKEAQRYRITGSLFLLALAVIFLPMLFDGAGLPARELEAVPRTAIDAFEVAEPAAPVPDPMPQVEALRRQVDDEGFHTQTRTRLGEPVLGEVNPATEVWAIQVASFADIDNARGFRTRLRDDGYEAFLSTIRTGSDTRTRVAVGPIQSQDQATRLQTELSSRYRVEARLMAFSN